MSQLADELLARCGPPLRPQAPVEPDVPVPLAVSGGPDSLALLVLAARAGLDALAVHVDHGLRTGSAAEADVVRRAAKRYGLGFESLRARVLPGPNLEARARVSRYRVLPGGVLTGHTMDDQAETVLINLLRGAGVDGLAGMRSVGTTPAGRSVLRPLLGLRRHETAALCASEGLSPVRDPSNDDLSILRNRIRAEVLPLLSQAAGRDIVAVLARQAELLAGDADLLDGLAGSLDPTDAKSLAAGDPSLARRAVRRWLRGVEATCAATDSGTGEVDVAAEHHPPSSAEVERVLDVARGLARACELTGGWVVRRREGRLSVLPPAAAQPAARPATQPAARPATQPTARPATQPTARPATQTATQPATQPVATQPATQPAHTPNDDRAGAPAR